jgi:hypothetical protein
VKIFLSDHIVQAYHSDTQQTIRGKGDKHVLVLFSGLTVNSEPPELLKNILQAIQLEIDTDTCYMSVPSDQTVSLAHTFIDRKFTKVLVFGLTAQQLSVKIMSPKNQWLTFMGAQILFTDTIEALNEQKELKLALWTKLKD